MEEENNWKVSNQNKKSGKKRFLRQFIVFVISILVIAVVALIIIHRNTNTPATTIEKVPVSENENKVEETNIVNEEDKVEKVKLGEKIYSIENKDFYFDNEEESESSGIKLYEYDNTNPKYAEIYYCLKTYETEEAYSYIFEAENENGESLLLNDRANSITERNIIGGEISSVKIDKEKVGSKINITIKEMCEHSARSRTLERETKVTINLNNDLKEQKKVDFKNNTSSYELENIKFETYKDDDVRKDTYGHYSENYKTTTYSIGITSQFGNRLLSEEQITFSSGNNINELNLDEAFEIERKIEENVGNYGLADKYKIYVSNGSGDITNEYEITFEDMKNLLDGKDVSVKGKKITLQDISNENNSKVSDSSKVKLGNDIPAIRYTYKNDNKTVNYMFIVEGYIYHISVPSGERYKENVNLFLDSLTKK